MKKIVFATHNAHKLAEIRGIVKDRIEILGLEDIHCHDDIEETGNTLEANALIKARYVKERYRLDCFADDTGLEVDALNGAPGVYSSRYAGPEGNARANMEKLMKAMEGTGDRAAQFRTVIALTRNGKEHLFEGIIRGKISDQPRGEKGFGYDPVFIPEGHAQTFAEMPATTKNQVSHRALAMGKLIDFLLNK